VEQTKEGGYIIVGDTGQKTGSIYSDIWLIKTDPEGNKVWDLIFSGKEDYQDLGRSVKQTPDGGYIIVGTQGQRFDVFGNQTHDIWLIKLGPETPEE